MHLPKTLVGLLIHLLCRYLMTDSKSRKVIIVENTYLPSYVKEQLSQTLFDNLKASRIVIFQGLADVDTLSGPVNLVHPVQSSITGCLWKDNRSGGGRRMARDDCDTGLSAALIQPLLKPHS